MIVTLVILASMLVLAATFKQPFLNKRQPTHHLQQKRNVFRVQPLHAAEIRIKIHGTSNAYTTLRQHDVVLYAIQSDTHSRALGVYRGDQILPLCNHEAWSVNFYVDPNQEAIPVDRLKNSGDLLRVVSSDKSGESYYVEEYIDSDVYIPLHDPNAPPKATLSTESTYTVVADISSEIEPLTEAENALVAMQKFIDSVKKGRQDGQLQQPQAAPVSATAKSDGSLVKVSTSPAQALNPVMSEAIVANGMVFVSGCVGVPKGESAPVEGGVQEQMRQALTNLQSVVSAAGAELKDVCKITIFLRDLDDIGAVNSVFLEFFTGATKPARTTVEVSRLPYGSQVEIDAIATIKQ
jgi:reactive intermediate/imine deaminase